MSSAVERKSFSERLQEALGQAGYPPSSPTQLARQFNLRSEDSPISSHAARKWLLGEAIPTQEKLRILAQWLGVDAAWLRFGDEGANAKGATLQSLEHQPRLQPKDLAIIENLQRLNNEHRQAVHTMVRLLVQGYARK